MTKDPNEYMEDPTSRFQDALSVQNACNPSGVAYSLWKCCCAVSRYHAGTDAVRTDPAVKLFVAKLADLVGLDYQWPRDAERKCEFHAAIAARGGKDDFNENEEYQKVHKNQ